MKQTETTVVKISSDIFDDKALITEGTCETIVELTYPEKHNAPMLVTMKRQGEEPTIRELIPGDTYTISHRFKAKFIKDLSRSNAFPITFKMDGQEYKLNRTKQNKLILTK
jgi:hypothetical protein